MEILSEQIRLQKFERQKQRVRELVAEDGMNATCSGFPCPHVLGAYKRIAELEEQVQDKTKPEVDNDTEQSRVG